MTQILVTGGSGYVGSHCVLELLKNNYEVIVIDSLINSIILNGQTLPESLRRVEIITGKSIRQFYLGSIEDGDLLDKIFSQHQIEVVMHFAALKSVNESIAKALLYYRNNVSGAITLLSTMEKYGVKKFIFSSSATVYGSPNYLPLDECHPIGRTCTNPYGKSKYMIEEILNDLHNSDPEWSIISLRYFNPVGAHHSGLIGEHPQGIPNNLMPYISQVAVKMRSHLNIFGNDYNTVDGTALRDYIHIDDLIIGHLLALKCILSVKQFIGYQPINLGCGQGISVLQMVEEFELATGEHIPIKFTKRRPGDLETIYADIKLAKKILNWEPKKTVEEMCSSTWNWQKNNPNGFLPLNTNNQPQL